MDNIKITESIAERDLNRRDFFKWIIRASVAATVFGLLDQISCGTVPQTGVQTSPYMVPQTADEKTVYALCDTVLPGRTSDPSGAPGAVDAGTMDFAYDKFYGVVQEFPLVLPLFNAEAQKQYGKPLYELDLAQRTTVLQNSETLLGLIDQIYMFLKGPFYIGMISTLGLEYMGDPGPNLGYRNQDFSFYKPMSTEITSDGNLP